MAKLPPNPVGVPPGHSYWNDWYEKLRNLVNNTVVLFTDLDFAGSNLTSIQTRNHNDLQNIQGGAPTDYYHLTSAQATALTGGFTGTGQIVRQTSPTLITPALGVASATSLAASGAVTAASVAATGAVTAATVTTTGTVAVGGTITVGGASIIIDQQPGDELRLNASPAGGSIVLRIAGANRVTFNNAGNVIITGGVTTGSTTLHTTSVALTNGAAAAAGTITNAPTAGNPTKWVPINDNGTTRYIPCW